MAPNKELIFEWLSKADGDFEAAHLLFKKRSKNKTNFIIAFHCQQAIEKYLKALLLCHDIKFPKSHDLVKLLELLSEKDPFLVSIRRDMSTLNPYAVDFRYPGDDIDRSETRLAVTIAKRLRKLLISRLNEFVQIR